ncbi:hypothetical protein [Chromobacterium sinusclupearum]|uniref:hypothetical protein n=1 Tax=Chromobacterium sinusclupearum TaxID=2077146 RepID=UPI0011AEF855|nr:hypothetical protein [Chromobacterium sinusclupearum]
MVFSGDYIISFSIFISACLVSNFASAVESCPFPVGLQASVGVASEAIYSKNKGIKKEDLLAKVPMATSDNVWLRALMQEVINEVYDYPAVSEVVYSTYRGELCFQKIKNPQKLVESNYTQAYPLLVSCEAIKDEHGQRKCAMQVVSKTVRLSD